MVERNKKYNQGNDFQIKKPVDLTRINSNNIGELLWWSYHLGTSPEKIISIISKSGNLLEEVQKHLKDH